MTKNRYTFHDVLIFSGTWHLHGTKQTRQQLRSQRLNLFTSDTRENNTKFLKCCLYITLKYLKSVHNVGMFITFMKI